MKPTRETYSELQLAYDFFNKNLFENSLPECLITLQREKQTHGYYSPKRFINKEHHQTDEIAMNPSYFSIRSIEDTLSTLVHEMVHLWQEHYGQSGRGRYHNKEWANKMIDLGLMPSSTGAEGGKKTGDSVSHYIVNGGAFDHSYKKLTTTQFRLSWADRFPPIKAVSNMITLANVKEGISPALKELHNWGIDVNSIPPEKKQTRAKLSCPDCRANVWGKPSLNIMCGDCGAKYLVADLAENTCDASN
ncbi:MAG: SprT-like domain-containing protein [Endozoicomonas sp. (ex Botrylloides leachii)]|nr:SprT-like domain-containing protein [Endozoicomonas sp. (ex Botrylloides leachii)]